ncbi:hypothetical protein AUC43_09185 [Hymenobacter sedentarius]|uniref:Uncharacterized protein n=1 Tax=Hymenobacter sedentarius TaxID=1411621 RepID=A0A0U3SGG4_9BACT|nr:hypothetical protein [Hymenobacter sedentarius]ALW85254.1 hypothetical protein AUC43_09185 [Hymenobacter sedentarius]
MTQPLLDALSALQRQEQHLLALTKKMVVPVDGRPGLSFIDIYSMAIVNRSLALIAGFNGMVRSNNYLGAAHVVRLHLDSLLRYAALWMVSDPNDFARSVMNGTKVNQLKDKHGTLLRDAHLRDVVAVQYPWVLDVYNQTSGFVHFSQKHISFSTMATNQELGVVQHSIARGDRFVQDESRIEGTEAMTAILECIGAHLIWWTESKQTP